MIGCGARETSPPATPLAGYDMLKRPQKKLAHSTSSRIFFQISIHPLPSLTLGFRSAPARCQGRMIPTAVNRTTSLRATTNTPLKDMASSNRLSIKAPPRSHTTHHRAAATRTKDLPRRPGRIASVLRSMADSRWASKANSTVPTMRATRKEMLDTSKLCLFQGLGFRHADRD